jgi:hypothetical protein
LENTVTDDRLQYETWFTDAEDATIAARKEAERARDYVNGIQLTSDEVETLKQRGQPPVVINRIRRKVEWLKGLEVKQRTDPKAFPRTPQHQEDAESVTDAIRYVCDDQDWDGVRSETYDDFLVEGFGGVEVVHKQNQRGEVDVVINHYPWDRLFYDPFSRKDDFSDARYKGVVLWMDGKDFKRDYPKHKDQVSKMAADFASDTYDDRPRNKWYDGKRDRIRVVLMWHLKGRDWHWVKFIRGAEIDSGESPYVDDEGESVCPLIMQSSYVGRDNDRYGIVRDMFDPQDEINKRRSKALHASTSRQTYGIKGAVDSIADMKRELASGEGHVDINVEAFEDAARVGMKPFDILPQGDQITAQFQLLQEAKNEIDMLGANSALEGETGENTSGRAVLARQQGGMIEIAALNDKLHRFTRTVYRHIWMRIKQFWDAPRWVRVTDDESAARFVGINQPITLQEKLGEMPEQEAIALIAQQLMLRPGDPRLQAPVGIRNAVQQLDVDIILEEVPDRVTLEGEVFEALLKYGPQIPPAVLIEADPTLPSKKKEKLLEMLQQPPAPTPSEQLELAQGEADVFETQARTQKLQAEAQAGFPLARYA